jgi:hypothetical protein
MPSYDTRYAHGSATANRCRASMERFMYMMRDTVEDSRNREDKEMGRWEALYVHF